MLKIFFTRGLACLVMLRYYCSKCSIHQPNTALAQVPVLLKKVKPKEELPDVMTAAWVKVNDLLNMGVAGEVTICVLNSGDVGLRFNATLDYWPLKKGPDRE
jgi:hypothetical protein